MLINKHILVSGEIAQQFPSVCMFSKTFNDVAFVLAFMQIYA